MRPVSRRRCDAMRRFAQSEPPRHTRARRRAGSRGQAGPRVRAGQSLPRRLDNSRARCDGHVRVAQAAYGQPGPA